VPSSPAHFDPSNQLRKLQEALRKVLDALRGIGAHDGDPVYAPVFKALRKADQLTTDALRRLDSGQSVSVQEFDMIGSLFETIKSAVF
jgi:hypothetical protein